MKFTPKPNSAILKAKKIYKFEMDGKKKKPILDGEGNKMYDLQDFYIEESAIEGVKKGKKAIVIVNGGVPIKDLETDTHVFLVIDAEDLYAVSI
jgi:hypothetical protein